MRARALALGRLERLPDGRVRLGLKRAWSDGTTGIELSALEFVEKLAAIIPPPRANQTLYAGVLAGNAAWRAEVVPKVATSTPAKRSCVIARRGVGGARRVEACEGGGPAGTGRAGRAASVLGRAVAESLCVRRLGLPALPEADEAADDRDPGTLHDAGAERVVEGDRAACGGVDVEVRGA